VVAAGWLRLLNLFRDDFRRIAMPWFWCWCLFRLWCCCVSSGA